MTQAPVVVFPDATAVTIDWLRAQLAARAHPIAGDVHKRIPRDRPARFVTVQRGGGTRHTKVSDAPLLLFECWAANDQDAHDDAQLCRALVFAMRGQSPSGVAVYRIEEAAGPQDLPHPDTPEQSRYVFTMSVAMRGA